MSFTVEKYSIEGVLLIKPQVFRDERGIFMETYNKKEFELIGITEDFVQDNFSISKKGTIRALHYQRDPYAQGKLVSVVQGRVWDVAVDLRRNSPTFKQWVGVELTKEGNEMFYIPPGFAHGFIALEDDTYFMYKCTNFYNKKSEGGIKWNDPDIGITWLDIGSIILSEKDNKLPFLKDADF